MGQQAIQVCLTTVWVLFASPIAEAITPQWWYGLGAVLAGALFVATFFLLPETKYERSLSAYQEESSSGDEMPNGGFNDGKPNHPETAPCTERPELDLVNYTSRTFKSDLRLWIGKPEWLKVWEVLRVCVSSSKLAPPQRSNLGVVHSKRQNFSFFQTYFGRSSSTAWSLVST